MKNEPEKLNEYRESDSLVCREALQNISGKLEGLGLKAVDISGNIEEVSARVQKESEDFYKLKKIAVDLAEKNKDVEQVALDSYNITREATGDVDQLKDSMDDSFHDIEHLISSVQQIESRMNGLSNALKKIGEVASGISRIAHKTNILALNATVVAGRAGQAGKSFSIVAQEVKDLSDQTSNATDEINATLKELESQADELMTIGTQSVEKAASVQKSTETAKTIMDRVAGTIHKVNAGAENINPAVKAIDQYCARTVEGLENMTGDVEHSSSELLQAEESTKALLEFVEQMMNEANIEGSQTNETAYIELARQLSRDVSKRFEEALEKGEVSRSDLFDGDYKAITGSNPQQYSAKWNHFGDRVLPELQEQAAQMLPNILAAVCADRNGYIGTHMNAVSHPQRTDDPEWNRANCRNRIIYADRVGSGAVKNTRPFLIQAYRRLMGEGLYQLAIDISSPVYVQGEHWGAVRVIVKVE